MKNAVEVLVANALDDLEAESLDVATALRLVARQAWNLGYDSAAVDNFGGRGPGGLDGSGSQRGCPPPGH
jgi:hypothetical protein